MFREIIFKLLEKNVRVSSVSSARVNQCSACGVCVRLCVLGKSLSLHTAQLGLGVGGCMSGGVGGGGRQTRCLTLEGILFHRARFTPPPLCPACLGVKQTTLNSRGRGHTRSVASCLPHGG